MARRRSKGPRKYFSVKDPTPMNPRRDKPDSEPEKPVLRGFIDPATWK